MVHGFVHEKYIRRLTTERYRIGDKYLAAFPNISHIFSFPALHTSLAFHSSDLPHLSDHYHPVYVIQAQLNEIYMTTSLCLQITTQLWQSQRGKIVYTRIIHLKKQQMVQVHTPAQSRVGALPHGGQQTYNTLSISTSSRLSLVNVTFYLKHISL